MSAISDTTTQLVEAIVIAHHPVRYDIKYFPELFKRMSELANIRTIMLDKGCNAEYVHELILSAGAISIIPARGDDVPIWRTRGSYRKQMKQNLPEKIEGQNGDDILCDQEEIWIDVRSESRNGRGVVTPSACLLYDVHHFLTFLMISTKS